MPGPEVQEPDSNGVAGTFFESILESRADWLGCWVEFAQKARFEKLVCLCHIK